MYMYNLYGTKRVHVYVLLAVPPTVGVGVAVTCIIVLVSILCGRWISGIACTCTCTCEVVHITMYSSMHKMEVWT